jgi:response regulator NasT
VPAVEVAIGRNREITALKEQTASLEDQLETRKVVDRAKGKLMDEFGMNEGAAFSFIQRRAMSERVTMRSIGQRIIDGDIKPDG